MSDSLKLCMGCMNQLGENGICSTCGYIDGTPYLPAYLAPKTVLNERYIVGKLLTYNGEGATYIGYDKVTNETVNIREFMPDTLCSRVRGSSIISVNPSKLVQFKNYMAEFSELSKSLSRMRTLSHISPALDIFLQNNTTYVVLEYIDGISLKHYLQENAGELTWQQVKKLFPPIFTTLSLIHNAGVIHRGISLDTIYYTKKGELKITGFNIAGSRTANSELAPELFVGFAAPEQYSSNNWQGTWTDVYAISAILYRCLTGCLPTEAVSRMGNDTLLEPAAINPNVPSNISKVIMSGLKMNGELRIQTITELVTKLFEQPEYMEQTRSNTTTVIIPRQVEKQEEAAEKKPLSKPKLLVIALAITFVVLSLILIVILILVMPQKDTKTVDKTNSSIGSSNVDSSSSDLSSGEAVTTTKPSDSSSIAPADTIPLPDLTKKPFESQANNEILKKYITMVRTDDYNALPVGQVYEQDIKAGTDVKPGTTVNVKVSKGPKIVKIPEFAGLTQAAYEAKLKELGITNYSFISFETNEYSEGLVAKLSKQPGEDFDRSSEALTISIAKASAATTSN